MPPRSANRPAKAAARMTPPAPAARAAVAPIVAPPWLRPAVVALAAALLFIWFSPEVADSDTWWHLKTGQYILQTHKLPVPDPFAFTTATAGSAYPAEETVRHFNLTHEWLAQILLYLVYAAGGFPGMVVFRSLLLMGVCALVGAVAWRRSNRFYLAVGAAIATGLIGDRYVSDRPFLISFLLFAATIALLEYRRWLWALPAMFVFWANCHGGFFLGWGLLGAYCAEAALDRYRGKPQAGDKRLYLISAIAVAASGLNPNFFRPVIMPLLYRESMLQRLLWEWQHTALWPLEPFQVMLFAAAIVMLLAWRRVRLVDWLLFLAFAFGALWAVRNVMLFGIVGPILIAAYFPGYSLWKRALPAIAEFAAAALLILGIGLGVASGTGLQFRAAEWKYPWGAAKFLEDHHIRSRMLNSYVQGGFLIWRLWPQEQVFIDGRALSDNVFLDFRNMAYKMAGSDPRQILDKYGIETIVLDGFEYTSGAPFLLVPVLGVATPVEWHLVYWDDTATIFMRHPPPDVPTLPNAYALNSIEGQCESYVAHDPYHPRCARGLGTLYVQLGENARARKWMAFYLNHAVERDPEAQSIYARLLSSGK
ncbi:MAG: hypothetical protein ABSG03_15975 [Bryobacteraceae bacterium]|jgi:hypothetical protein